MRLVDHHVHGALRDTPDRADARSAAHRVRPAGAAVDDDVRLAARPRDPPVVRALARPRTRRRGRGVRRAPHRARRGRGHPAACCATAGSSTTSSRPATPRARARPRRDGRRRAGGSAAEIVRLESVFEALAAEVGAAAAVRTFPEVLAERAAAAAGLKSVVAYRFGFDFAPEPPTHAEAVAAAGVDARAGGAAGPPRGRPDPAALPALARCRARAAAAVALRLRRPRPRPAPLRPAAAHPLPPAGRAARRRRAPAALLPVPPPGGLPRAGVPARLLRRRPRGQPHRAELRRRGRRVAGARPVRQDPLLVGRLRARRAAPPRRAPVAARACPRAGRLGRGRRGEPGRRRPDHPHDRPRERAACVRVAPGRRARRSCGGRDRRGRRRTTARARGGRGGVLPRLPPARCAACPAPRAAVAVPHPDLHARRAAADRRARRRQAAVADLRRARGRPAHHARADHPRRPPVRDPAPGPPARGAGALRPARGRARRDRRRRRRRARPPRRAGPQPRRARRAPGGSASPCSTTSWARSSPAS